MSWLRGTMPIMALIDENYRDDCKLRGQDIVDAERYLAMRDRAPATGRGVPFFSGREAEIRAFRKMAKKLGKDAGAEHGQDCSRGRAHCVPEPLGASSW